MLPDPPIVITDNARAAAGEQTDLPPARWSAVFAMTLCAFALIASEFMPVSLLTPMANDLGVTEGLAGRGIAISGALAIVTSLCMPALARSMDRKKLLLLLTGLMGLSGLVVAWADTYFLYMAGRAMIGVVVGGFWALSAATVMRLVPADRVPRALAVLNGGNALATVVAAPLGAYLGAVIGWRGAFLCLIPIAAMVVAWQWISLPSMAATPRPAGTGNVLRLLKRRATALGMIACGAFFMGQFALFTYVRPYLEGTVHVSAPMLSLLLLLMGIAGLVGTASIGVLLKWSLGRTLLLIPLAMACIAAALMLEDLSIVAVAALLAIWGLLATSAPVGWWQWIAQTLPEEAEAAGGLMVAVIQLAIALGSTVGGQLFDAGGHRAAFLAAAVVLLAASALAWWAARAIDNRESAARSE